MLADVSCAQMLGLTLDSVFVIGVCCEVFDEERQRRGKSWIAMKSAHSAKKFRVRAERVTE